MTELTLENLDPTDRDDGLFHALKNSLKLVGSHNQLLYKNLRMGEKVRPYSPSDHLNHIDWKVFARTDSLLVRQEREEACAKVRIRCDVSPSMQFPPADFFIPHLMMKKTLALKIACHLAFCHSKAGDEVSFTFFNEGKETGYALRFSSDVVPFYERAEEDLNFIQQLPPPVAGNETIFYSLSDGLNEGFFSHHESRRSLHCFIHTLSSLECESEWMPEDVSLAYGTLTLKEYLGKALKQNKTYDDQIKEWQHKLEQECEEEGSFYFPVHEKLPLILYKQGLARIWS